MNTYDAVEELYFKHKVSFECLEEEFLNSFDIPPEILSDTIKRILIEAVSTKGQRIFLINYSYKMKDMFVYFSIMIYFFFLSISPFKRRKYKNHDYDVVFDCWNKQAFDSYYQSLFNKLPFTKIAIFTWVKGYTIENLPVFDKSNQKIFENRISGQIFKTQICNFFKYKKLSLQTNINFINLALRLMRYLALYTTDSRDISSKFLISAGDNYYNSMRNFIYHKNGIKNIILIQNGMRGGKNATTSGELYVHCDYYVGFGEYYIDNLYGTIKHKMPIGSLKLAQETDNHKVTDEIDVMFIEQIAFIEVDKGYKFSLYIKIVELLIAFALSHPKYKIVYRVRPLKLDTYSHDLDKMTIINDLYDRLKSANIVFDDYSKNSYEPLLRSKVVVYYNSALGVEALGLDKKVLCCNLDKLDYALGIENEIGILVENSVELFAQKLLTLLETDNDEIKEYYLKKKRKFMNLEGNPIDKIVNILIKEMEQ